MFELLKKYIEENPEKEIMLCFSSGICKKFYPCRSKIKFAADNSCIIIKSVSDIDIIPERSVERIKII